MITAEQIKAAVIKKGYHWFDDKVNIVGVRTKDQTPDKFNDFITISYKGEFHCFEATTEPGVYWLKNPMRVTGTFVLPTGQWIDHWGFGIHHTYEALVLKGLIAGWRDNNKDNLVNPDKSKVYSDGQAVNIHHAHENIIQSVIDKYSAGCQVIRKFSDWLIFFGICKASKQEFFSYTLIEENDL
jgi:hypothetical protein